MKVSDLFEKVTADLVAAIEAGASGWRMPWQQLAAGGTPHSVDGRPYRGWNALVLAWTAADRGWSSSTFATYRGWQRHRAQVRRGERGAQVVLWKPTERAGQKIILQRELPDLGMQLLDVGGGYFPGLRGRAGEDISRSF